MENENVKYYRPRFERWIQSNKWDSIANELYDTDIAVITKVMNSEKDGDCNWLIWSNCGHVLERIRKIGKSIKF